MYQLVSAAFVAIFSSLPALPAGSPAHPLPDPTAYPVHLKQRFVFPNPANHRIEVLYRFDSSSGNLADLAGVTIREWLTVTATCGQVINTPLGPLVTLPQPFIIVLPVSGAGPETWDAATGTIDDTHGTYPTTTPMTLPGIPPVGVPYPMNSPSSWKIHQVFQWSRDGVTWRDMHHVPIVTTRQVIWIPRAFGLFSYYQRIEFQGEKLDNSMGVGGTPTFIPCI